MSVWFSRATSLRRGWRLLAWLVAALVAATGVNAGLSADAWAGAAPVKTRAAAVEPAKVGSRPDLVSAQVTARSQGSPVEAEALRTETSTTWANPDGTLTTETFAAPVRFKDAQGVWRDVDFELSADAGGTVSPEGSPADVLLQGASKGATGKALPASGKAPVVAADAGGKGRVAVGWGKKLGAPKLAGSTARWANIVPGGDMAVTPTRTGFETSLILKDAASAQGLVAGSGADAGKLVWSFPIDVTGVTAKQGTDSSIVFTDASGAQVGTLDLPLAFDAKINPGSGLPATTEAKLRLGAVTKNADGSSSATVSMLVDNTWVTDPGRVFPITIDPTYASTTIAASFDTRVQTGATVDYSSDTELRVGTFDGGATVARSFVSFPLAGLKSKQVITAKLNLFESWSWSCTASPVNVYSAGAASTSTRWSAQPVIGAQAGTGSFAAGHDSGCPAKWQGIDITSLASTWASNADATGSIAFKAGSETDNNGWKRFSSKEGANPPSITVTYNRAPNTAAAPTFIASGTYQSIGYVVGGKITFTTKASDADASQVKALIEIHNSTTTSTTSLVASCTTPLGASGANIACVNGTDLPNPGTYYVRAKTTDEKGLSASAWSGWTTIRRAGTAPAAPSVSCAGYADGSWTTTAPGNDVSCTVAASGAGLNAGVRMDIYLDGASSPSKSVELNHAAGSTTVTVSKANGGHSVRAVVVGGANLTGESTTSFGYGAAAMLTPINLAATSGKVQVTAAGPAGSGSATANGAKVQWRIAGSGGSWTDADTLSVTTKNGVATAAGVFNAAGTNTTVRTPLLLEVQVCLTYTGGGAGCTFAQSPLTVTRLPHAFGNGYPTQDVGPGQVAQYTGELYIAASDVTLLGLGVHRSTLSYQGDGTLTGWPTDVPNSVFGPGWTANIDGAGAAGYTLIDNTTIDGTIALVDEDGSAMVFRQPGNGRVSAKTGVYAAATQDTVDAGGKLEVTGAGASAQVKVTDVGGTYTVFTPTNASSTPMAWGAASVAEPGAAGTTTYTRDSAGRTTRILGGLPDGYTAASCPATGAMQPGCRAVNITYNTAGNGTGQVGSITGTLWDPATAAMKTTTLATFDYDTSKRLVKATDSRTGLATSYSWVGSSTRLASITPAGQAAYRISYDTSNRVKQVTRDAPVAGGSAAALGSFVYGVPTSGAGLPDVTSATTGKWVQGSPASTGYGFFGPQHPVTSSAAGDIGSADWAYADLSYVDAQGYTVNTAAFGGGRWLVTATEYNADGTITRSIDAKAIGNIVEQNKQLTHEAVGMYASDYLYDGNQTIRMTPASQVTLPGGVTIFARLKTVAKTDEDAPNNGLNPATGRPYNLPTSQTLVVDGASISESDGKYSQKTYSYSSNETGYTKGWETGRIVKIVTDGNASVTTYNSRGEIVSESDAGLDYSIVYYTAQENPTFASCGASANSAAWAGLECRRTPSITANTGPKPLTKVTTSYDMWLNPTSVVETSGSTARTTTTRYDAAGRKTWQRTTSNLTDSPDRAAQFTHYQTGTGLVDYTGVANAAGTDATTTRTTTVFDLWGRATSSTNELGDTSSTVYDAAGRVASVTDSKGSISYEYDGTDAAGKVERRGVVTKLTVSRPGTGGALVYTGAYDEAGTLVTQKLPGNVTAVTETNELMQPIGLTYIGRVTPVDAWPDDDTGDIGWNSTGAPKPGPWLAWSMDRDPQGRIVREYTGEGAAFDGSSTTPDNPSEGDSGHLKVGDAYAYDRAYSYDTQGRLAKVIDRTMQNAVGPLSPEDPSTWDNRCEVREYTFNTDGARTGSKATSFNDGDCANTAAGNQNITTISNSLDSADRLTGSTKNGTASSGYVYDGLGRQTKIPAADTPNLSSSDTTISYYADDLVQSVTNSGSATTYSLDEAGRRLTQSTTGGWNDGMAVIRHYTDSSDNPSWSVTTKAGQADTWSKYAPGLDGDLGATINQDGSAAIALSDPHDNTVTTVNIPAAQASGGTTYGISGWSATTEYGGLPINWRWTDTTVTGPLGYGYLGAKERSTTSESAGLTLMGARLYNWTTGTFTSPDPIPGGNDTSYGYPNDPINFSDVTGAYGYRYSYNLAWAPWRAVSSVVKWIQQNFSKVWPLPSTCKSLKLGATCYFAGNPVRVIQMRAWGWMFLSLPGHVEGKDKKINFSFNRHLGVHKMTVTAWGPDNTWCNRNRACTAANKVFAFSSWLAFALLIMIRANWIF